jgi:hypothetical protein
MLHEHRPALRAEQITVRRAQGADEPPPKREAA